MAFGRKSTKTEREHWYREWIFRESAERPIVTGPKAESYSMSTTIDWFRYNVRHCLPTNVDRVSVKDVCEPKCFDNLANICHETLDLLGYKRRNLWIPLGLFAGERFTLQASRE